MSKSASIIEVEVFTAYGEVDTNEGRGGRYVVGHFLKKELAVKAAAQKGVWGTSGDITHRTVHAVTFVDADLERATHIVGDRIDMSYEDPQEVRERALAKLTPAEKKSLGLK